MVLDSIFNKEVRLLRKVEKLYVRGERSISTNPTQARSYLNETMKEIARNNQIIKDKKTGFSAVLAKIGNLLSEINDFKNSEQAFKLALSYDGKNIYAYIYYAKSLAKRKDYKKAHLIAEQAIEINRKNREAWDTKAQIYEMEGDVDEALKIFLTLINLYPDDLKYYNRYLKYKPNDEEILLKKGILLYNHRNYIDAAKTFETLISIIPGKKEAYLYMGASYEKLERYEEAINAFKKVLSLDPGDKHAWVNLAVIYKRRGEYEDALKSIKEGIKIDPNDGKSWEIRAKVEYDMENYEDALKSVEEAMNYDNAKNALILKREILKKNYIPEEMAKTCNQLIEMGERDVSIYFDLAKAEYSLKNYNEALEVIDLVLKTSPHHVPTLILKKETLKAMERWEKVIDICEKILEIDTKNIDAFADMAKAYEKIEKYESALHFLKKATEISPKSVELWKLRRDIAKKLNKPTEIVDSCIGVTSLVEDFDSYMDLAKAYYALGRFNEAKKVLNKALRIKDDANAWNLFGMVNYKLKDFENSKKAFEKATEKEPEVKKYWSNLGWILEKLEKYNEALHCFENALKLDSMDMRLWYEKGICLQKLGNEEEALHCFDEALKINQKFTKALLEKGNILLHLEHMDDALKTFNLLLKLEPGNHVATYKIALIYFKKGEYESCMKNVEDSLKYTKTEEYLELKKDCCKAMKNMDCVIEVSRNILDINGRNLSAYRDLAHAYISLGKVDSAVNTYRKGIEIFPDNDSLMYELKDLLIKEKRYADVVSIGKKILEIIPEDFKTIMDMGIAYINMQNYDNAENYLIRALNIKKTKEIYDLLGELYMMKNDYRSAIKYYADSLKIEEDPEINYKMAKAHYHLEELDFALKEIRKELRKKKMAKYYTLGALIYSNSGKLKNALNYAQKALKLEDTPEIRTMVGKALLDSGEYTEAISILKVPAKENNIQAMKLLAMALEKENRIDDAREIYRRILEIDKNSADAYVGLGRINLAMKKYESARDAYEMAYKINPNSREICENLSFVYEKLGNFKDALRYIDLAIEIEANNKFLWNTKGQLLMQLEKYDDAKRAFEKALAIDNDFKTAS